MNGPYQIRNLGNQGQEKGTIYSPYFYHITTGEKIKKSLIFHCQIRQKYHRYHIKAIGAETIVLRCVNRNCPARASARVPKESGLITIKGSRSSGKSGKEKKNLSTRLFRSSSPRPRKLHFFTKKTTVDREQKIKEIMALFLEQGNLEDPISLCNFAGKFAAYDENVTLFEEFL